VCAFGVSEKREDMHVHNRAFLTIDARHNFATAIQKWHLKIFVSNLHLFRKRSAYLRMITPSLCIRFSSVSNYALFWYEESKQTENMITPSPCIRFSSVSICIFVPEQQVK
jgi:hypothetical protein